MPEAMARMGEDYRYYPISKTFTQYYTRANTKRFGERGCQIFSIAPGAFDTPMLRESDDAALAGVAAGTAFGRLGQPRRWPTSSCVSWSPATIILPASTLFWTAANSA